MISATMALIIVELITQIGGFAAVWWKARSAEKLSRPTGNGFAQEVMASLARLEARQAKTDEAVQRHTEHHLLWEEIHRRG